MTYISALGWWIRLGDEPLGPCSTSSERGHFEPAPCSQAEGLASLAFEGVAAILPTPVGSWGTAAESPPLSVPRAWR